MNKEIWKPIENYENLYEISNLGNVRLFKSKRILKPSVDDKGYKQIVLTKNNKRKSHKIHKLVALAFLDKTHFKYMPSESKNLIDLKEIQVNHINEIKFDNRVENLEFCTKKYNCNYGTRPRRCTIHFEKKVCQIKNGKVIKIYNSLKQAEKETKISYQGISACCRNILKKTGNYEWRYANE